MALNREREISNEVFTGQSKIHDKAAGGLGGAMQAILQKQGAVAVDGGAITALTDSSGGSSPGSVGLAAQVAVANISGGTTGVLATGVGSLDTSADTVMDAYNALLQQINLVYTELGAGSVGVGPGSATLPTIVLLDVAVAANTDDNDSLDFETYQLIEAELLRAQATVISNINRCKRAVGLAELTVDAGAGSAQGDIADGDDIGTTAITNGVAIAGGVTSVLKTAVDAILVDLQDNIAYFADELDLVTNIPATNNLTYFAG